MNVHVSITVIVQLKGGLITHYNKNKSYAFHNDVMCSVQTPVEGSMRALQSPVAYHIVCT